MSTDMDKLKVLNAKPYRDQAVYFLNAQWTYFSEHPEECEKVWNAVHVCCQLDSRGEEGNELDELKAHILLERIEGAVTVKEMREALRAVDIDFNRMVSLAEFLIFKYKANYHEVVNAPQGSEEDQKRIVEAQNAVSNAQKALEESEAQKKIALETENKSRAAAREANNKKDLAQHAESDAKAAEKAAEEAKDLALQKETTAIELEGEAKKSENAARDAEAKAIEEEAHAKDAEQQAVASEADATNREGVARDAEEQARSDEAASLAKADEAAGKEAELAELENEQKQAELAVQAAVEDIKREEETFKKTCDGLRSTSEDASKGPVVRGTAANELAQLLVKDPLPLQRAKILEEAALRKQQRLTKSAAETREVATKAREVAEQFAKQASNQRAKAEQDREAAEQAREKATKDREAATKDRESAEASRADAESTRQTAEQERANAESARSQASDAARKSEDDAEAASKSRGIAEDQRAAAEHAAQLAHEAKEAAEASRVKAEEKVTESFEKIALAEEHLEKVKKTVTGAGRGKVWYLEREMIEAKKFMSPAQLARLAKLEAAGQGPVSLSNALGGPATVVA